MGSNLDYFIWTEVFNCGKIGKIAIDSFLKYHPNLIVNVFGFEEDFNWIKEDSRIVRHTFVKSSVFTKIIFKANNRINGFKGKIDLTDLEEGFSHGHLGTARLWSFIIQNRNEGYLLHFDSDTIFLDNLIDEMLELRTNFDVVCPVRSYKYNPMNNEYFKSFEDVAATNCFLFNKSKIDTFAFNQLVSMCQGLFNPLGHRVIDFFDSISFNIRKNGGKFFYLDFDDVGATNLIGSRDNLFSVINNFNTPFKLDFGRKLLHFSAVGSGMNIYHKKPINIPSSYQTYAIDRYALFCKIFYEEDLGVDLSSYNFLVDYLKNEFNK
jgi:hypothetical protein